LGEFVSRLFFDAISAHNDFQSVFCDPRFFSPPRSVLSITLTAEKITRPTVLPKLTKLINYALPTILLVVLYNAFRLEIGNYYHLRYVNSFYQTVYNEDLNLFNLIWQINYTMLFLSLLSFANINKFKNFALGFINLALNALILLVFLGGGLFLLGELRESYLSPTTRFRRRFFIF
jgi:hypothetical protein